MCINSGSMHDMTAADSESCQTVSVAASVVDRRTQRSASVDTNRSRS